MIKHSTKIILKIILVVMIPNIVNGQTILNGIIGSDSTLPLSNSPFLVTGNLLIMPNVVLTIEPGVIVKFDLNIELLLRGKLVANGTMLDSIYFTSDNQTLGSWEGIRIDNYLNAKVECSYFNAKYSFSLFNNQRYIGVDTVIKLTNSTIDSAGGIFTAVNSNNIQFYDSCIFSNSTGAFNAFNSIFKNCLFYNGSTAISNTQSGSNGTIVDNCIFHNFNYVTLTGRCAVTNSTFYDNNIAVEASSYGPTSFHFNNVYQNTVGIHSSNVNINPINQITQNRICNNVNNVLLWYSPDFNVIDNCWCLTDSSQIRATMHDFFSQTGLGIVNFSPFDTTCSFATNIKDIIIPDFHFQIYPNPSSEYLILTVSTNSVNSLLKVFNVIGELELFSIIKMTKTNLDISRLSNGLHIIEISEGNNIQRQKFIKKENIH